MSGGYPHIAAYLASPPAAALEWIWDLPAGWSYAETRRIKQTGDVSGRDPATGLLLGISCPELERRGHGAWYARYEVPRSAD